MRHPANNVRLRLSQGSIALVLAILVPLAGCSFVEKAGPKPTSGRANIDLDVPQIMRGTVASECVLVGYPQAGSWTYADVVVRGYGLVVGLGEGGSRFLPPDIRAHMLQEMARHGVGTPSGGFRDLKPEDMLDSPDTAVVTVEAVIPPGATEGTTFDVRVVADARTGVTSLEGGTLYTTDLRPGPLRTGGGQAFPLARASGPIFINPFADPGATGRDTINRTVGRILGRGLVIKDIPMKLKLASPSHTRARLIQDAINLRFPQERGQRDLTARGESDEFIALTVPHSWRQNIDEFIAILQHTTIRIVNPDAVALSVRRSVIANPSYAPAAALRWEALGRASLPIINELYTYPEELPRLAALTAGARLNDPLVINHLVEMATSGSDDARIRAVEMLAKMRTHPLVDSTLRKSLNDELLEVRLSAYEALAKRSDAYMSRTAVDDKFVLDIVDSEFPLIYVTQVGTPRLVLFGTGLSIESPVTLKAWSNRFMLKGTSAEERSVEVYYRPLDAVQGDIHTVDRGLEPFIQFAAHDSTIESPAPGLGLSYSETVGAVHQIWRQGHINADFKAEQDRILAAIMRTERESEVDERPEFANPEEVSDDLFLTPEEASKSLPDVQKDLGKMAPDPLSQKPPNQR
ncbi:MAG: flagellar basal body P-ring protein FlgI [Planctomycetota bacterium]|jgi:hypothetical protein